MQINLELDRLYNNRAAIPEHPAIFARWRTQSHATRSQQHCTLNVQYGAEPLQNMDLFHAPNARGLMIFIHGGYWRSLDKDDFSFVAEPWLAAGLNVAVINYRLCPAVTLDQITSDCRAAILWLIRNGPALGVPFTRCLLVGHSAGAHLVAMMLTSDWPALGIEPPKFVGAVVLSGIYDLAPLLVTAVNADLKLDASSVQWQSPIHLTAQPTAPVDVLVGADESSEFIRQSHLLVQHWPSCRPTELVAGANHFTIVDQFLKPDSAGLLRAMDRFVQPA